MSNTYSFDYEIMQLPDTGGIPYVISKVTTYLGDHKDALQVSPKVIVELAYIEIRICHYEYLWALLVIHIISLQAND